MTDYIKLAKIKYNNKNFIVFIDDNKNKTFLEVKTKNDKETYYYPLLEDIINLKLIFNNNDKLYTKKYRFKDKIYSRLKRNSPITNFTLGVIIGVGLTCSYKVVKEKYPLFGYNDDHIIVVKDNKELELMGLEPVTFDDVRLTLLNNENIEGKYRDYTLEYIRRLEERLPEADLRIFNKNLETLYFEVVPLNDWDEEGIDGFYNYVDNYISVKEEYEDLDTEKSVVFHELNHSATTAIYEKVMIDGEYYKVKKAYQDLSNEYGTGTMEALTEILKDYLLTENYEYYFDPERRTYNTYLIPTNNVYQLLKLTDDYSFYDYFTGDIYGFEEKVNEYGLGNMLNLIDFEVAAYRERHIEVMEEYNLEFYQEIMHKERFKKIVDEEKNINENDELSVYKKLKNSSLCLNKDKLEIIDDIYKDSFVDIKIGNESFKLKRTYNVISSDNKVTTNTIDFNGQINIEIYNGKDKIITGEPSRIFFYKDEEDEDIYKAGYTEYTIIPAVHGEIRHYYDATTNAVINMEEDKILYLNEFLEYYMGIDGTDENCYDVKIDMSKIDEKIGRRLNVERILKMNKD